MSNCLFAKKIRHLYSFGLFILVWGILLPSIVYSAPTDKSNISQYKLPAKLVADSIHYDSINDQLTASENVSLSFSGVEIKADQLIITKDKTVVSTKNVSISRGDNTFNPTSLSFNLKKNEVSITDIAIKIDLPESKHPLYVQIKNLTDLPDLKKGIDGVITSCELDPPHYYATASHFDFVPNERVFAFNVTHYNPILGFPLFLWSPIYSYDLGTRKFIWNFPTIGKKETDGWGWFIQNTFDYDRLDGNDSSLYLDWFSSNSFGNTKGLGLGINHQYKFNDHRGAIYFYQLSEQDTGNVNQKQSFDYNYEPSPFLKVSTSYQKKDGVKINSRGYEDNESKKIIYNYDELGNKFSAKIEEKQNFFSPQKNFNFNFSREHNKRKYIDFEWKNFNNYIGNQNVQNGKLSLLTLFPESSLKNDIFYYGKESLNNTSDAIERLRYTSTYTKTFSSTIEFKAVIQSQSQLADLSPTSNSNDYDMFYRLPEFTLNVKNLKLNGFNITQTMTAARYQEVRRTLGKIREFPENVDMGMEPNTYAYSSKVNQSFSKLPFSSTFSLNADYLQYIFKTPGKTLFEGDAFYKVSFTPSLKSEFFGFLKTSTNFIWNHIPDDANSPFNKFDAFTSKSTISNRLTESLTFFIISEKIASWTHTAGYDWIRKKPDGYTTKLKIAPTKSTKINLSTGRNLELGTWNSLNTDLSYTPTKNQSYTFHVTQDLNEGSLQNSYFTLKFPYGDDPDYQWSVQTQFIYVPTTFSNTLNINKYEMQTISIVKNDHCRTFNFSYNKPLEEFKFSLTINAFPKDSIGIKKTRDLYKLEGILDESSKERL
ncbi:hypothetical protein HOG98_06375 [bacterium]|jgi:hypothetical protein|nr:hypothetical protein [bacterium]